MCIITHIWLYISIYVCIANAHTHVRIYIYTYICTYVCIYIYTHMVIALSLYMYTHTHIHTYIHIYIYIHIHIYTYLSAIERCRTAPFAAARHCIAPVHWLPPVPLYSSCGSISCLAPPGGGWDLENPMPGPKVLACYNYHVPQSNGFQNLQLKCHRTLPHCTFRCCTALYRASSLAATCTALFELWQHQLPGPPILLVLLQLCFKCSERTGPRLPSSSTSLSARHRSRGGNGELLSWSTCLCV